MTDHAITQSMLGNADTCLRGFQYGLQRPAWVKQVGGADRAVGTAFHAALASYYEQRIDNPSALPDVAKMIAEGCRIFEVSTTIDLYDNTPIDQFKWSDRVPDIAAAFELIERMVTSYINEDWWLGLEHTILAVEINEHFTDPQSGRTFKLGADLVSSIGTTIRLTDHKTAGKAWPQGKESPRKQNQSALYTWAARRRWPEFATVEFAFDIIMFPGARTPVRFERRITTPTPAHEQAVVGKALDLMNLYETIVVGQGRDLPANPASTLCNPKWCDYWDGCPHGAALDHDSPLVIGYRLAPPITDRAITTVAATPDEGEELGGDHPSVVELRKAYGALGARQKAWVDMKRTEALHAHADFHLLPSKDCPRYTERRIATMSGVVALAAAEADDDDTVRTIVRFVSLDDAAEWPTVPAGAACGMLGAEEAILFRATCRAFVGGMLAFDFSGEHPALVEVGA